MLFLRLTKAQSPHAVLKLAHLATGNIPYAVRLIQEGLRALRVDRKGMAGEGACLLKLPGPAWEVSRAASSAFLVKRARQPSIVSSIPQFALIADSLAHVSLSPCQNKNLLISLNQ